MKIDKSAYRRASQAEAENQSQETIKKFSVIRTLIETRDLYGYRTIARLLSYVRGKKLVKGSPVRIYPTHKSRVGFKLACLKELKKYRTVQEQEMFNRLAEVSTEELLNITRALGAVRCAMRYGNESQLVAIKTQDATGKELKIEILPPTELEQERELSMSKRKLAGWLRSCKRKNKGRRLPKVTKKLAPKKKVKVSGKTYAQQLLGHLSYISNDKYGEGSFDKPKAESAAPRHFVLDKAMMHKWTTQTKPESKYVVVSPLSGFIYSEHRVKAAAQRAARKIPQSLVYKKQVID